MKITKQNDVNSTVLISYSCRLRSERHKQITKAYYTNYGGLGLIWRSRPYSSTVFNQVAHYCSTPSNLVPQMKPKNRYRQAVHSHFQHKSYQCRSTKTALQPIGRGVDQFRSCCCGHYQMVNTDTALHSQTLQYLLHIPTIIQHFQ